jgi:hypothetical protein
MRTTPSTLTVLAAATLTVLLMPGIAVHQLSAQAPPAGAAAEIDELIQSARDNGIAFLNTRDRRIGARARRDLDQAERRVRSEMRRNAACEFCVEYQASIHLFRSTFGFAEEFGACLQVVNDGMARFPQNARLAYIKGYAHIGLGERRAAAAAFNRYLTLSPDGPQAEEVKQVLASIESPF